MGPTRLFPYDPPPAQRSAKDRIRDAALSCFAIRGVAATSLRTVAEAAEVSVGLVQHHFGTKLALVAAVDQYVLAQVGEALEATALTDAPVDGLDDAGQRLTSLMAERPDVMSYLGRALAEGGTLGAVVFDGLLAISAAQRDEFVRQGNPRPDLDPEWAALNPLILRVGAIILHPYIELRLRKSFFAEPELRRWDAAVTSLIRHGLFLDAPEARERGRGE